MCYWTFSQHLRELGTRSHCLQTPTAEKCNTVKASGKKMLPEVYISTGFYYEFIQTDLKFVVFKAGMWKRSFSVEAEAEARKNLPLPLPHRLFD